jgi:hypothetical protein
MGLRRQGGTGGLQASREGLAGGRPLGTWGPLSLLAPVLLPHTPPPTPVHTLAGKLALPGLGSQAAWHCARLAAERGQQGGVSSRGAEDVARRPGHEQDPRPEAGGPEGEGTLGGHRVDAWWAAGNAAGLGAGLKEDRGGGRGGTKQGSARRPAGSSMACLPALAGLLAAEVGLGSMGGACAWAAGRNSRHCRQAMHWRKGQARQAGPRAVKEKNIPRPANCCSQLFPPSSCLAGGGGKLPLEADAERMQNFN